VSVYRNAGGAPEAFVTPDSAPGAALPSEDGTRAGRPGASTVDRWGRATDGSAVIDECPMTEDCPGYDRDRRVCLLRSDDCEVAPTRGEAVPIVESPEVLTPDASSEAVAW